MYIFKLQRAWNWIWNSRRCGRSSTTVSKSPPVVDCVLQHILNGQQTVSSSCLLRITDLEGMASSWPGKPGNDCRLCLVRCHEEHGLALYHPPPPPAFFGNEGNLKAHKEMQRTFSEHGHVVLGNFRSRFNKLGSELIYQFYNSMKHVGFNFTGHSLDEIANKFSYAGRRGGIRIPTVLVAKPRNQSIS